MQPLSGLGGKRSSILLMAAMTSRVNRSPSPACRASCLAAASALCVIAAGRMSPTGSSPLERSHEPELALFREDAGVQVGFQIPETLLDQSVFCIGQRPVIQPFVLG
jgi:hypothetical protein